MRNLAVIPTLLLTAFLAPLCLHAREFAVLTYNVENLFDADKVAIFEDYAETDDPDTYNPGKLLGKLRTITNVLKSFNDGQGPEVACFNEVELDFTPDSKVTDLQAFLDKYKNTTAEKMLTSGLNDDIRGLPVEALLLKHLEDQGLKGYHVAIGADRPDFEAMASTEKGVHKKGHKNAVFSKFPIVETRSHPTPDARDILEVKLDVDGKPFTIFVNHWKSGAGNPAAEQARLLNAKTLRGRLDEILAADPSADILIAGDFNSQYNQRQTYPFMNTTGINDVLGSQGNEAATAGARGFSLYNLWYELPRGKRHSDEYDGTWGTLMQNMITPGLYDFNGVQYVDNSFRVVALDGVNTRTALKLPRRWSNLGGGHGASDHFPIAAQFRTVADNAPAKRVEPGNPGVEDAAGEPLKVDFASIAADNVPVFGAKTPDEAKKSIGEIFRVRGKIVSRKPLTVEVVGNEYLLWGQSPALGKQLRSFRKESEIEFLGELSVHRGKLQFVVADPSWLLSQPAAP